MSPRRAMGWVHFLASFLTNNNDAKSLASLAIRHVAGKEGVMRFRVDRHGLGAGECFRRLYHFKFSRRDFFDHADRPIPAVGAHGHTQSRVVGRAVHTIADTDCRQQLAAFAVQHIHLLISTSRKEAIMIASGFLPALMRLISLRVLRSKTLTELSRPFELNPSFCSGAKATPCTPCVLGISPTSLPLSRSTTCTWVLRGT